MSHECNLPTDSQGKFYHIDCAQGDIAPYILACANPERSHVMAEFLDSRELKGKNREYVVYTGFYRKIPLSIMGTGIGGPATAIAIVEAAQCQHNATFIRVGTSGAIQPHIAPGDLIITDKCIRDENTSHYYAEPSIEARSNSEVLEALIRAAQELGFSHHVGTTCTTSDFYAGQARQIDGFPSREPEKIDRLRALGALNLEMEMSIFLTLAAVSTYRLRAGGLTVALCNRINGSWSDSEEFEARAIKTAFRAVEILFSMDCHNDSHKQTGK